MENIFENEAVLTFFVQVGVIAGIFSLALCWFSLFSRYCSNLPCIDPQDEENGGNANVGAKKKPDLPPNYLQADLYSQMEVSPSDVLFPPPSYSELALASPPTPLRVPSSPPTVTLAFAASERRRNSAPSVFTAPMVSSVPNAATLAHELECGLVSNPPRWRLQPIQPRLLSRRWLETLLGFGVGTGPRGRQVNHVFERDDEQEVDQVQVRDGQGGVAGTQNGDRRVSFFAYDNLGMELVDSAEADLEGNNSINDESYDNESRNSNYNNESNNNNNNNNNNNDDDDDNNNNSINNINSISNNNEEHQDQSQVCDDDQNGDNINNDNISNDNHNDNNENDVCNGACSNSALCADSLAREIDGNLDKITKRQEEEELFYDQERKRHSVNVTVTVHVSPCDDDIGHNFSQS